MPEDPSKTPVSGTPEATPPTTPPAQDDSGDGDDLPDWVKDPARAYKEIKRVRMEAKETRVELDKRLKAESDASKQARAAEIQKLADDNEFKKLAERLKAENDELAAKVAQREFDDRRREVAESVGLPAGAWKRLQGKDEAELKADAESLKLLLAPTAADKPASPSRSGTTPAPGGKPQGLTDEQRRARLRGLGETIFDKRG